MMKSIYLFSIVGAMLLLIVMIPLEAKAEMETDITNKFTIALNKKLKESVNYYHDNSIKIVDSIQKAKADITKNIQIDDPNTPENEEVTEKYQADIAVAFVEFKQKRDSLFFFRKSEVYYYDLENGEFLTLSNLSLNGEVKEFFQSHFSNFGKHITPLSLVFAMVLISAILIVPFLIMIFQYKGNDFNLPVYNSEIFKG